MTTQAVYEQPRQQDIVERGTSREAADAIMRRIAIMQALFVRAERDGVAITREVWPA